VAPGTLVAMPLILLILLGLLTVSERRRRRRRRRRRQRTGRRQFRGGAIGHVARGVKYHVGNSIRGLRAMAQWFRKADRDVQKTRDNRLVITHWPRPMIRDGFVDPLGKLSRWRTVDSMTLAEVQRLRAPGDYQIQTLEADAQECARLNIDPVYEPKTKRLQNQADWDYIAKYAKGLGLKPRGYALPTHWGALKYMNKAGIPSTRLRGR
jgi:hypothetical protein